MRTVECCIVDDSVAATVCAATPAAVHRERLRIWDMAIRCPFSKQSCQKHTFSSSFPFFNVLTVCVLDNSGKRVPCRLSASDESVFGTFSAKSWVSDPPALAKWLVLWWSGSRGEETEAPFGTGAIPERLKKFEKELSAERCKDVFGRCVSDLISYSRSLLAWFCYMWSCATTKLWIGSVDGMSARVWRLASSVASC